jgi:hypothetical protein
MTKTNERAQEIKNLRTQIKERLAELKIAADKIKTEADFLKDQDTKLRAAAKTERDAEKVRKKQARDKKKADREAKAKAKAEKPKGRQSKTRAKKEAPKTDKQKGEESLVHQVASELMKDYGLHADSTVKEIRDIRRAYAKKYHPDIVGGDGKRMQIANVMLDGAEKTAKWKEQRAEAA